MYEANELLLDRQIAPIEFTKEQISEWYYEKQIFVSSTMKDLQKDRQAVKQAIISLGAKPRMFEDWIKDEVSRTAFLKEVRQCDLLILLLGKLYGSPDSTGFPPTRQEYNEAKRLGKPILALQNYQMSQLREQEAIYWIRELEQERVVNRYENLTQLKQRIRNGLTEFASERMIHWVKIDNIIFLAQNIELTETGDFGEKQITIKAKIKDQRIASSFDTLSQQMRSQHHITFGIDSIECTKVRINKSSFAVGQVVYTIIGETQSYYSRPKHFLAETGTINQMSHREFLENNLRALIYNQSSKDINDFARGLPQGELLQIYEDWKDEAEYFPIVARFYIIEMLIGVKAVVHSISYLNIGKVQKNKIHIQIGVLPFQDINGEPIELDDYLDLTLPKRKPRAW